MLFRNVLSSVFVAALASGCTGVVVGDALGGDEGSSLGVGKGDELGDGTDGPGGIGDGSGTGGGQDTGAEQKSFPKGPAVPPGEFDPDHLLDDDMIFGGEAISVAQVQDFLEQKGSYLAGYHDPSNGRSGADLITNVAKDHGVNPLYIIARIQTESSLITSGTSDYLGQATGCGCPDGAGCDAALSGFASQVDCAALTMQEYFAEMDQDGETRASWAPGRTRSTSDPCSVTPVNKATAAMYTYTPWVGEFGDSCGTPEWGGSSLVALAYYLSWSLYYWGTEP
jgi:hypothetical protein